MEFLGDSTSAAMFGLGVLIMTVILLKRATRRRKKLSTVGCAGLVETSRPAELPVQVVRWQVEMHDLARDLKAELDSKMSALQSLIRIAKEESSQLEGAIERASRLTASRDEQECAAFENADETEWNDEGLPGNPDERTAVFSLADRGRSSRLIADEVGSTIGDVELILSSRGCDE